MNPKTEKIIALINKADKDYAVSEKLLEEQNDLYWDSICFHCQQCIEKYLKSFLIYKEIVFPKTHDLEFLLSMCIASDDKFKDFDLSEFSGYGVEIRYDDISVTADETKKAFETAKTVKDYIMNRIEFDE